MSDDNEKLPEGISPHNENLTADDLKGYIKCMRILELIEHHLTGVDGAVEIPLMRSASRLGVERSVLQICDKMAKIELNALPMGEAPGL